MSKSKFLIVMLTLAVILVSVIPALAQDSITASVNTGAVNVRSGPGMQFGSLASLPFGYGVNLVARNNEGNWVLVALTNGVSGWVNVNYLYVAGNVYSLPISETPVTPAVVPTGSITGYLSANVRTSPDPNGQVIASAPLGTAVILLGRNYNATWVQIRLPNGTTGWVETIAVTGTVPVRGLVRTDGSVFVPGAPDLPGSGSNTGATAYLVRSGDTLWRIAQTYNVNIHTLAAYNGIYNYDLIYAGQTLYIP